MAIVAPTIPSSTTTVSAVELKPTQSNKQFYAYSGEISVTTSETTMISINDIGKRDILLCLEIGPKTTSSSIFTLTVKSNGQTIYTEANADSAIRVQNDYKFILPANTSVEVSLKSSSASVTWTIAGYGYYL